MAPRRGLNKGRGLGSLIPPKETPDQEIKEPSENTAKEEPGKKASSAVHSVQKAEKKETASGEDDGSQEILSVRLSQVVPNQSQPRKVFEEEGLEKLADSIRQYGILQPLLVKKKGRYYEIIAGERRWRAARKAGLKEVPVILRTFNPQDAAAISLIENLQREDLNPIEEAQAYRKLIDEFGLTQEEAAARVSRSRTAVTNSLRLLKLSDEVQQMIISGDLSMGHARALLALDEEDRQHQAALSVIQKGLSVRETEKLVKKLQNPPARTEKTASAGNPQLEASLRVLEESLRRRLGTQVTIRQSGKEKGKIEIEYYSFNDLDRLTEMIRGGEDR